MATKTRKQLTLNFTIEEFEGRSGQIPDNLLQNVQELANNLQVLRDHLGKPIKIISGYRSPAYNKSIDGAKNSQHVPAKAADIQVPGMHPNDVKAEIEQLIKSGKMKKGGVGLYTTFVHYDTRAFNARWKGSGVKDDRPSNPLSSKSVASNESVEENESEGVA